MKFGLNRGTFRRTRSRSALAAIAVALVGLVALGGCAATSPHASPDAGKRTPRAAPRPRPTPTAPSTPTGIGFDKSAHSTDDPASIWIVVNKARPLPAGSAPYQPSDLVYPDVPNINHQPMRQETATALLELFAAGKAESGLSFSVQSGYRSFESQRSIYDSDVAAHGVAYADSITARPGSSEHQTGLAVDISAVPAACSLDPCFANTPHGKWLAANAWRFGFLLRYPADKVEVTGFSFEPWHFRYIGKPLAARLHELGVKTLEEFFGLPGGMTYPPSPAPRG